jgi:hypothetical protein
MATEKDNAFVRFLLEETKAGRIRWQPAAEPDRFVASFKGKYNVVVDKSQDPDDQSFYFYVKLSDDADQELLMVYNSENILVRELFFIVRRISLNVDLAIDEIMKSVKGDSPANTPISDEDIPF